MTYELDIVYLSTKAAWPHLVARGGGCVINVGSVSAVRGRASCTSTRTVPPRAASSPSPST